VVTAGEAVDPVMPELVVATVLTRPSARYVVDVVRELDPDVSTTVAGANSAEYFVVAVLGMVGPVSGAAAGATRHTSPAHSGLPLHGAVEAL
jgi:hypothetical protein